MDRKRGLVPAGLAIGESWEISVEPDFPGRTDADEPLDAVLRAAPEAWLGAASARGSSTELLVKLLDAADELSVQIHPADDYPGLAEGEGGKPESWYVVERDPGACLYLGLAEGVDEAALRQALERGDDVSRLLFRVAVEPGDFFLIEPGTAHAIGRGCLLVEPQRVTPGTKGLTYRFWDWNRRYDAAGALDPSGAPRALHLEHALAVTRFDAPRGEAMLARIRVRTGAVDRGAVAARIRLSGPGAPIPSDDLAVSRLAGDGEVTIEAGSLQGLTVLEGAIDVHGAGAPLAVARGRSAILPAAGAHRLVLRGAHALLSAVP